MRYADIIVPGGPQNKKAIEFIGDNLKMKLIELGLAQQREEMPKLIGSSVHKKLDEG